MGLSLSLFNPDFIPPPLSLSLLHTLSLPLLHAFPLSLPLSPSPALFLSHILSLSCGKQVNYTLRPWKLERPSPQELARGIGDHLIDTDTVIASGYGRPDGFYDDKPWSFQELLTRLRQQGRAEDVEENLIPALRRVVHGLFVAAGHQKSHAGAPCSPFALGCFADTVRWQHFGIDVNVEDVQGKLVPYLLEVNKGPDMAGIREDVLDDLWASIWATVGTHGPAPEWGHGKPVPASMDLVYDSHHAKAALEPPPAAP